MNARIVIAPSADGKHYLRFVAANGQTLGVSETYSTLSNARRAATDWYDAMNEITTEGLVASVTQESGDER